MASESARRTAGSERKACGLAPPKWSERVSGPRLWSLSVWLTTRRSTMVPKPATTVPLPDATICSSTSGSICRFQA